MTVRDVMVRLGRARSTVERWLRSGALKAARPDWKYIVSEEDLTRFLTTHKYTPPKRRELRRPESLDAARARRDRAALDVRRETGA